MLLRLDFPVLLDDQPLQIKSTISVRKVILYVSLLVMSSKTVQLSAE